MSQVLVLSPHPDDEAIGCGGTLCRHIDEGDVVYVVFLTSGEMGGHGRSISETVSLREAEARAAAEIIGYTEYNFWRLPDGKVRVTREVTKKLCELLEALHPALIYVPHDREMHPDHRAAARLLRRSLAESRGTGIQPLVRSYEVWTPLQEMDAIIDVSDYVDRKRAAIRTYETQCEVMRFDEAVLGLNRYRGEMHSWPGGQYAEIFRETCQAEVLHHNRHSVPERMENGSHFN